jgi:hypothetical protein
MVVHWLQPIGNTVQYEKHTSSVIGVLVVGGTLTSHFWLNILPLCRDETIRYFITVNDLAAIVDRLHVQPMALPCFLVLAEGFIVDWFLAPLPPPGEVVDPVELIQTVLDIMMTYHTKS